METVSLVASRRAERGKAVNRLRRAASVPAVVYGHNTEPLAITLDRKTFEKAYASAGESTLINLSIDGGGAMKTLIKEVQHHPVSDLPTHVDFQAVSLTEELETTIPVEVTGESNAVKTLGGVLVHGLTELKVRCLPTALVHNFTIDITNLTEFGMMITVAEVPVPAGIEVLEEPETVVVSIAAPKAEEAASIPGEAPVAADVEAVKQKAPEEGAAAAGAGDKSEKAEKPEKKDK